MERWRRVSTPRKTTPATDRKLIIACKRNRFDSVPKLTVVWNFGSGDPSPHGYSYCTRPELRVPTRQRTSASGSHCHSVSGSVPDPNSPVAIEITRPFSHRTCLRYSWPTCARRLSFTSCISCRSERQTDRPVESHRPR